MGGSAETKRTETTTASSESIAGELSAGPNVDLASGADTWQRASVVIAEQGDITYCTDGRLGLSGSVIADIKEDGRDGGNLRISAASLEFADLRNRDKYENRGFGKLRVPFECGALLFPNS